MLPEPIKPSPAVTQEEKQKQLDRDIREMISALSHRLGDLQKHSSSHHDGDGDTEDDQGGVRIITLAGSNMGATMRSELDEIKPSGLDGGLVGEHEASLDTYVNSNFQSINNSIMMGGSYSTNDPGVHLDILEYQGEGESHKHRHGKKGKKKEKETSKSDQHSDD
uniref:Uncharacterized protein n=1 Tax=Davidia involucrata TaxID=16924 RepID=A0A5B7CC70_DAVIN